MKKKIEEALKRIEKDVFYGKGRFKERDLWDCIIFGKRKLRKDSGSYSMRWFVAIIKEEEIPEGMEQKVIEELRKIGVRKVDGEAKYDYVDKAGECMVEVCTMEFYKAVKGCG